MKNVFGDTSFFLAMINTFDVHHGAAMKWSENRDLKVVTTEFVLLELGNSLVASKGRPRFTALATQVRRSALFDLVPLSSVLMQKGESLFASRGDKEWSLTDCISFEVMRERRMQDALTADHHFKQAGFRVLL